MSLCHVKSLVYYEHQPNEYVTEHSHSCYECVFYLNGRGTVTAEGDTVEYVGPTLTLMSPSIKHDEKTQEFSSLYIVLFETDGIEIPKQFSHLPLSEDVAWILQYFQNMRQEEADKQNYYQDIINSYFSLVLYYFLRKTSVGGGQRTPTKELVSRLKTFMKENYNQSIDFSQIAASFGYSYDRLRHIFQKETNVSIHQYFLNCKLYVAKQMLLSTDMSISEIAFRCGFGSSIHFSNFFKSKMNISPRQFRDSQKNQVDIGVFRIKRETGGKNE